MNLRVSFVSEVREVDFGHIGKHLQKGDSIFITSVPSQKLAIADHQEMVHCAERFPKLTKVSE